MPTKKNEHKVRFDAASPLFERLAADYRRAVEEAERLHRRLSPSDERDLDDDVAGDDAAAAADSPRESGRATRLRRQLRAAEAALAVAHAALAAHARATARGTWRERRRPERPRRGVAAA